MKLVLGSSSPARRQLLERLQLPFSVISPDIDESPLAGETAEDMVVRLSQQKAFAVAQQLIGPHLVIGSDLIGTLGNTHLGKPGTHQQAVAQLLAMSGQTVVFWAGLCLLNTVTQRQQLHRECIIAQVRQLSLLEIENYLAREPAYECAGSCHIEGLGIALFTKVESVDPNTLMGLPTIALINFLMAEGMSPLNYHSINV